MVGLWRFVAEKIEDVEDYRYFGYIQKYVCEGSLVSLTGAC